MQRVSILSIIKKAYVKQPAPVQKPVEPVKPMYILQKVCAMCDPIYIRV